MAWTNGRKLDRLIAELQQQVAGRNNGAPTHRTGKSVGKGRGGGGQHNRGNDRAPFVNEACNCCGKVGHLKKNCRFKDRACNACGMNGHLAAVCRHHPNTTVTQKAVDNTANKKPVVEPVKTSVIINTDC